MLRIELIKIGSPFVRWQLQSSKDRIEVHSPTSGEKAILSVSDQVQETMEQLSALCNVRPDDISSLHSKPRVTTLADGVLVLFIAKHWPAIAAADSDTLYHVVLAHAFPLSLLRRMFSHTLQHLSAVINGKQLMLLDSRQLTLVETNGVARTNIERQHHRVLQANREVTIRRTGLIEPLLSDWKDFCAWRFKVELDTKHLDILHTIFSSPDFTVKEFWLNDECIARTLIYVDQTQRVLLDVLAPWSQRYARYRLGIYTAVHNLLEAHQRRLRYCLCYGHYAYKDEIVSGLLPTTF